MREDKRKRLEIPTLRTAMSPRGVDIESRNIQKEKLFFTPRDNRSSKRMWSNWLERVFSTAERSNTERPVRTWKELARLKNIEY